MTPLQIRLARARSDSLAAYRLIRRVRHLYIRVCRLAVLTDPTNQSLDRAAQRMVDVGLFAPTRPLKEVRYTILKRLWTIETGKHRWSPFERDGWHNWYRAQGFAGGQWRRDAA